MTRKQFYSFMATASIAGITWVALNLAAPATMHSVPLCPFKAVTGLPCPSCGSTHSVVNIMKHNWAAAWNDNPIGFFLAACLVIFPFWLLFDLLERRGTFYNFYVTAIAFIQKRTVAITLITLVAANWMWSMYKHTL